MSINFVFEAFKHTSLNSSTTQISRSGVFWIFWDLWRLLSSFTAMLLGDVIFLKPREFTKNAVGYTHRTRCGGYADMGWLRLVGSLRLYVSFAKEPYERDDILQRRPIILRSRLIAATPYPYTFVQ